ncbi:MAG TPA: ABC transporter permease, partial [Patescibacteria group bacterium]|nr:ABC transporter permease [Patescibacteria group bacterium]
MSAPAGVIRREGRAWRPMLLEFLAEYGFIVFFAIWVVYLSFATTQFLTLSNLLIVLRQASIFGIPAIGATFVMIIGEIDISFGSLLGLAGAVGASLIVGGQSPAVGFIAAVAVGAVVGSMNGFLVTVV